MSRIFDALQQSEREQSSDDRSAAPQGLELLKRSERREDSARETAASALEERTTKIAEVPAIPGRDKAASGAAPEAQVVLEQTLTSGQRAEMLRRFQSVPISTPEEGRLVCLTDRESPTAEAIRLLGVRLRDMRRFRPLKKVLITSSIPQEGKSTIAGNLACALARGSEEKVLLIDGDMRRPALRRVFGVDKLPGVSDLLQKQKELQSCIHCLEGAGLWFLPEGEVLRNPLEILQSAELTARMHELTAWFDWIVIDSPPVLPLADTSIWMRLADGIVLVARQGTTEKHQLKKGLEALDRQKLLGALLNGASPSAYSAYYYRTPPLS